MWLYDFRMDDKIVTWWKFKIEFEIDEKKFYVFAEKFNKKYFERENFSYFPRLATITKIREDEKKNTFKA